jgi:3-dehydroquinate dehydratase-2
MRSDLTIAIINGPNLNLLGSREPGVYGSTTLAELEADLMATGEELGIDVVCYQKNGEGELIELLHDLARAGVDGVVINAGAYTHTSVGIRDALSGTSLPFIEVHISNVYAREEFRHHSYLSDIASGVIVGLGTRGYELGLVALVEKLRT